MTQNAKEARLVFQAVVVLQVAPGVIMVPDTGPGTGVMGEFVPTVAVI
jgi:hypothetical protein